MSKKLDRQSLIEAINACRDLTEEQKGDLQQLLNETPKYGLVWEDTPEDAYERMRTEIPVLREDKTKAIVNGNDYPNHVIIEGDNLHALADLCYTHAGAIDVIYIDPPYNTGNKDFVYNDQFIDRENAYRHSKWLSFMEKRLRLAHSLLSDKGAIFISIDDNEYADLKLLCDDIFGAESFLGTVIWEKTDSPRMDVTGFSVRHDYILVYGMLNFHLKRIKSETIPEHYNRVDNQGRRYYTKPMRIMGGHISDSLFYPLTAPDGTKVLPYDKNGNKSGWRWSIKKVNEESERIEWVKGKNGWNPYFRIYAENRRDMPAETLWPFTVVGSTRTAKNYLNSILGDNAFSYPKPITLIEYILKIAGEKDSTILDFFAGSGTTLDAVIHRNHEEKGGHRQCILVTNNENNICEEVTYPRNKKVIEGYDTPKGGHVEGLHDNNLRYFKMDSVPRQPLRHNRQALAAAMVDMLRIKHNVYTPCDHVGTLPTNPPTTRYYEDRGRGLLILMDSTRIPAMVEAIKGMTIYNIYVYVYSDGSSSYDDEFAAVADKVSVYALPAPMLRTYHRLAPEMGETPIEEPREELTESEAADTGADYTTNEM